MNSLFTHLIQKQLQKNTKRMTKYCNQIIYHYKNCVINHISMSHYINVVVKYTVNQSEDRDVATLIAFVLFFHLPHR